MAPSVNLTAHSPPARIPKLKYRNPLPSDQTSLLLQHSQDTGTPSAYFQDRSPTPDLKTASTSSRPSFETASLTSSSLASTPSSAASSNDSRSSKKKKKSGSVLGFLSLKEPSQVALEQFAEQQRKQTASRGTSTPNSKPSSVYAGQKLPANVPKVNSKWDGVPDSVKQRYSTSSGSSKDNRSSISSRGSLASQLKTTPWNDSKISVMTDETRNPPNSIASAATSMVDVTSQEEAASIVSSPTTTTLSKVSYYSPRAPTASGAMSSGPREADGFRETISGPSPKLSDSTVDARSSTDESGDFRADSPASSTDSADTVIRDTADTIFRKLNDRPHQSYWEGEAAAVQQSDKDHVPDSHDFLFSEQLVVDRQKNDSPMASPPMSHYAPPRPVHNFSRPRAHNTPPILRMAIRSAYRRTTSGTALPTLYEASSASTETLETVQNDVEIRSITPSSIAPSELSKHWYESPRERLGLGGRLKMNDALPWDSPDEPPALSDSGS